MRQCPLRGDPHTVSTKNGCPGAVLCFAAGSVATQIYQREQLSYVDPFQAGEDQRHQRYRYITPLKRDTANTTTYASKASITQSEDADRRVNTRDYYIDDSQRAWKEI